MFSAHHDQGETQLFWSQTWAAAQITPYSPHICTVQGASANISYPVRSRCETHCGFYKTQSAGSNVRFDRLDDWFDGIAGSTL